ncbi:MAG TPA: hypothetical protein VKR58_04595, partial [Aquella sp.]|nr:hypothetical protein [Aquella sp.]
SIVAILDYQNSRNKIGDFSVLYHREHNASCCSAVLELGWNSVGCHPTTFVESPWPSHYLLAKEYRLRRRF